MAKISVNDTLSMYLQDILDTKNNTEKAITAILYLKTDYVDLNTANQTVWRTNNLPIQITMYDSIYYVDYFGLDEGYTYNDQPCSGIGMFKYITQDGTNVKQLIDVIWFGSLNGMHLNRINDQFALKDRVYDFDADSDVDVVLDYDDVLAKMLSIEANNDVMVSGINAALNSNASDAISAFNAYTSDMQSTLSGSGILLKDRVKGALGNSSPATMMSLLLNKIYGALSTLSGSSNRVILSDKKYYVEGFFGQQKLKAVINLASTVTLSVITVIKPVLGFSLSFISNSIQSLYSRFMEMRDQTVIQIDENATGNLFAQRLLAISIPKATFEAQDFSITSSGVTYHGLSMINECISMNGCCVIQSPCLAYIISADDDSTKFYVEIYSRFDYSGLSACPLFSCYWTPPSGSGNPSFHNNYSLNIGSVSSGIYSSNGSVIGNEASDDTCKLALAFSIIVLMGVLSDRSDLGWKSQCNTNPSYSTAMSIADINGWSTSKFSNGSACTWYNMVNYIIPSISVEVLSTHAGYYDAPLVIQIFGCLYYELYYTILAGSSNPNNVKVIHTCVTPNASMIKFYPPKYSKYAFMNTMVIISAIALTTAAVAVTTTLMKAKANKYLAKSFADVEAAKYRYENDPTDENFNAYWKLSKNYNKKAILLGSSRISRINMGEVNANSTSLVDSFNNLSYDKLNSAIGDTKRDINSNVTEKTAAISNLIS